MAGYPATDSAMISHGQSMLSFRKSLKKIDDGLGSKDIQKLCFLCRDFTDVPHRELERFKRGVELFSALEKVDLLSGYDVSLLFELLELIRRRDLLKIARQIWPGSEVKKPKLSAYRKLLLDIANNTTSSEHEEMKAMADLPYSMEEIHNPIQFIIALEKESLITQDNVTYLMDLLENKQNVKKVRTYMETQPKTGKPMQQDPAEHAVPIHYNHNPLGYMGIGLQPVNPVPPDSLWTPDSLTSVPGKSGTLAHQPSGEGDDTAGIQKQMEGLQVSEKIEEKLSNEEPGDENLTVESTDQLQNRLIATGQKKVDGEEQLPSILALNNTLSMTAREQEEISNTGGENLQVLSQNMCPAKPSDPAVPAAMPQTAIIQCEERIDITRNLGRCYRMTTKPCGICLIINNDKFYKGEGLKAKKLKDRMGSDKDVGVLLNCFTKFNFKTISLENLTSMEMFNQLNNVRGSAELKEHDAFVCCILTHGKMGNLAGSDGNYLEIREIISLFAAEKCPQLAGKPKMFFIQACQGKEEQNLHSVDIEPDDSPKHGLGFGLGETVPNQADFLLGFATVPGYVSYRSRSSGSWYISALVDALNANYLKEDVMSVLTIVNQKLSNATANTNHGDKGQVPAPITTLRKKVYFHREEMVEYE